MKIFKLTVMTYVNHIFAMVISIFMGLPLYNVAQGHPYLFSLLTTLVYTIFLYSFAWNTGYRDARHIPGYEPDLKVPVLISVYTAIIPVVLLAIRLIFPDIWSVNIPVAVGEVDFFVKDCRAYGTPDILYRMWFFHLAAFVPNGNIFAYISEIFFLPILIFTGYFVGMKRFNLRAYLKQKIVFKDTDKK